LTDSPDFTLAQARKLKSREAISALFERGTATKSWPLIAQHLEWELPGQVPSQVAFNVSKRRFPRAVDRNRVKRLLREAWRHERHGLDAALENANLRWAMVFLYVGKELPEFSELRIRMRDVLQKLQRKLS